MLFIKKLSRYTNINIFDHKAKPLPIKRLNISSINLHLVNAKFKAHNFGNKAVSFK